MIKIENLNLSYGDKIVLREFSLELPRKGIIGLTGPSGCGKTTLLRVLAGLEQPDGGSISGLTGGDTAFLFQENRLLPWRTAEQNVTDVLPRERREEADHWLAFAELEGENHTLPGALSGGMARRLAIARCAAFGTGKLLLLDEPFAGVDIQRAERMMARLKQQGFSAVLVSHEAPVLALCDSVYTFDGPPLFAGSP